MSSVISSDTRCVSRQRFWGVFRWFPRLAPFGCKLARPLRPAVGDHLPEDHRSPPDKHRRPTVHPAHDPALHRVDGESVIWGLGVGDRIFVGK